MFQVSFLSSNYAQKSMFHSLNRSDKICPDVNHSRLIKSVFVRIRNCGLIWPLSYHSVPGGRPPDNHVWPWEIIDNQPSDRKISYLNTLLYIVTFSPYLLQIVRFWWFINYESAICSVNCRPLNHIRKRGSTN